MRGIYLVSIPHRKARNQVKKRPQFIYFLFQFLIGRLETKGMVAVNDVCHMFQFLIGRLETLGTGSQYLREGHVSIPHRKARNPITRTLTSMKNAVSIPHRKARNPSTTCQFYQFYQVSIPHRKARNIPGANKYRGQPLVSIPHRKARNL